MAQNNDNNNVNNIEVIREINDRYVVIKYFDAEVIYDKETKFINATKLCQHISKVTGKKKQLKHWMELKQTQKFIEDVSRKAVAGIPATGKSTEDNNNSPTAQKQATENLEINNLSYVVSAGDSSVSEIRGTYLHLDLIPQLCNWASKEYAFKISYIINYINGIKDYDSAYSKLKNDKLKEKDDEIESKTEEIKKVEEEYQKQLKAKDEELKAKEKELINKENELKKVKKDLKESEKKNEKKTIIIKEKNEKVKELEQKIKDKTEELEDLRKTKSDDDIEIQKLKRDIKLLKSQLEEALKNNKSLTERMDDFMKAGEKEREEYKKREEQHRKEMKQSQEELKEYKQEMNKMLTAHDILINQMSIIIKKNFKVETENKEIKNELKSIPEIILIFISEEDDKQLYISRIKKDTESRVIKKLKDLKYKVFNKYQTYNSVIKYNEAIKEYKEAGFISTKRNYITLINITLDEFIEKIKETI